MAPLRGLTYNAPRIYAVVNAVMSVMRIHLVIMCRTIEEVPAEYVILQSATFPSPSLLVFAFLSFPFVPWPVVSYHSLFTEPLLYRTFHSHLQRRETKVDATRCTRSAVVRFQRFGGFGCIACQATSATDGKVREFWWTHADALWKCIV